MEIRACSSCGVLFPRTSEFFYKHPTGGLYGQCRTCICAVSARWRKNNPEKVKAYSKKSKLRRNYGITLDERIGMAHNQKGLCAWCEKPLPNEGLAGIGCPIDHCHDTGVLRGIVHIQCNVDIGALERERLRHPDPIAHLIEYNLRAELRGAL